jgi:predicted P-loop ATPase
MSYSYIKTVFPNFKTSTIHNERIYNDIIASGTGDLHAFEPTDTPKIYNINKNPNPPKETTKATQMQPPAPINSIETFGNGNADANEISSITLPQEKELEMNCDVHSCTNVVSHVLKCESCKKMLMSQLKLSESNFLSQDILEIVMYVLFGLLLLILLDKLK